MINFSTEHLFSWGTSAFWFFLLQSSLFYFSFKPGFLQTVCWVKSAVLSRIPAWENVISLSSPILSLLLLCIFGLLVCLFVFLILFIYEKSELNPCVF